MNLLKKFYEERIYTKDVPLFGDLTEQEKIGLSKTHSFAIFSLHHRIAELKATILNSINLN